MNNVGVSNKTVAEWLKKRGYWQDAVYRFMKNKLAVAGFIISLILILDLVISFSLLFGYLFNLLFRSVVLFHRPFSGDFICCFLAAVASAHQA